MLKITVYRKSSRTRFSLLWTLLEITERIYYSKHMCYTWRTHTHYERVADNLCNFTREGIYVYPPKTKTALAASGTNVWNLLFNPAREIIKEKVNVEKPHWINCENLSENILYRVCKKISDVASHTADSRGAEKNLEILLYRPQLIAKSSVFFDIRKDTWTEKFDL